MGTPKRAAPPHGDQGDSDGGQGHKHVFIKKPGATGGLAGWPEASDPDSALSQPRRPGRPCAAPPRAPLQTTTGTAHPALCSRCMLFTWVGLMDKASYHRRASSRSAELRHLAAHVEDVVGHGEEVGSFLRAGHGLRGLPDADVDFRCENEHRRMHPESPPPDACRRPGLWLRPSLPRPGRGPRPAPASKWEQPGDSPSCPQQGHESHGTGPPGDTCQQQEGLRPAGPPPQEDSAPGLHPETPAPGRLPPEDTHPRPTQDTGLSSDGHRTRAGWAQDGPSRRCTAPQRQWRAAPRPVLLKPARLTKATVEAQCSCSPSGRWHST